MGMIGAMGWRGVGLPPLVLREPQHERPRTGEGRHETCPYGEWGHVHPTHRGWIHALAHFQPDCSGMTEGEGSVGGTSMVMGLGGG